MKRFIVSMYLIFIALSISTLSIGHYYHNKLDDAIKERISLKDSVYKYQFSDWLLSNHYRRLHSEKTIIMELYYEKYFGEEYNKTLK